MDKIGKPRGLIDYMALTDETAERAGNPPKPIWKHILRPRTILYTTLWSLIGLGLVFALFIRPEINMSVAPVRNPTFVTLSDGSIRNAYDVRLRNKNGEERPFQLSLTSDSLLNIDLEGLDGNVVQVPADETLFQRVYVTAAAGSDAANADRTEFRLWVEDQVSDERAHNDTVFNGNP